jgi:hypothetical protein
VKPTFSSQSREEAKLAALRQVTATEKVSMFAFNKNHIENNKQIT